MYPSFSVKILLKKKNNNHIFKCIKIMSHAHTNKTKNVTKMKVFKSTYQSFQVHKATIIINIL